MIKQLVDYLHVKENYKLIAIDLGKQQAFDADPKEMRQTNFTENLNWAGEATMFFTLKEEKKANICFITWYCKSIFWIYFIKTINFMKIE